jgi:hypothetical protein
MQGLWVWSRVDDVVTVFTVPTTVIYLDFTSTDIPNNIPDETSMVETYRCETTCRMYNSVVIPRGLKYRRLKSPILPCPPK